MMDKKDRIISIEEGVYIRDVAIVTAMLVFTRQVFRESRVDFRISIVRLLSIG